MLQADDIVSERLQPINWVYNPNLFTGLCGVKGGEVRTFDICTLLNLLKKKTENKNNLNR